MRGRRSGVAVQDSERVWRRSVGMWGEETGSSAAGQVLSGPRVGSCVVVCPLCAFQQASDGGDPQMDSDEGHASDDSVIVHEARAAEAPARI